MQGYKSVNSLLTKYGGEYQQGEKYVVIGQVNGWGVRISYLNDPEPDLSYMSEEQASKHGTEFFMCYIDVELLHNDKCPACKNDYYSENNPCTCKAYDHVGCGGTEYRLMGYSITENRFVTETVNDLLSELLSANAMHRGER